MLETRKVGNNAQRYARRFS